jgi:hypothetical protein
MDGLLRTQSGDWKDGWSVGQTPAEVETRRRAELMHEVCIVGSDTHRLKTEADKELAEHRRTSSAFSDPEDELDEMRYEMEVKEVGPVGLKSAEELQEDVKKIMLHCEELQDGMTLYEHTWTASLKAEKEKAAKAAEERWMRAVDAEKKSTIKLTSQLVKTEELLWEEQHRQLATAENLENLRRATAAYALTVGCSTDGLHAEVKTLQEKNAELVEVLEMHRSEEDFLGLLSIVQLMMLLFAIIWNHL